MDPTSPTANAIMLGGPFDEHRTYLEQAVDTYRMFEPQELGPFPLDGEVKAQEKVPIHRYIFKFKHKGFFIYAYDGKG